MIRCPNDEFQPFRDCLPGHQRRWPCAVLVSADVFMTDLPPIESFCCAYWDYLRKLRDEPNAADYPSLCECAADSVRRFCRNEFEKTTLQKAIETKVA